MTPVQFYLAGHGAFEVHNVATSGREDAGAAHAIVGTIIGVVVLLALLAGFAARLPRRLLAMTGLPGHGPAEACLDELASQRHLR